MDEINDMEKGISTINESTRFLKDVTLLLFSAQDTVDWLTENLKKRGGVQKISTDFVGWKILKSK